MQAVRRRTTLALAAAATPASVAIVALASAATPTEPALRSPAIVVKDAPDTRGKLDIARAALENRGRLKVVVTMQERWEATDLVDDGPPGSICVKFWTKGAVSGRAADHLACVTAKVPAGGSGPVLRGAVYEEKRGLLKRSGSLTVERPTTRTVVMRFSQTAIGKPKRARLAFETSTFDGCTTVPGGCIDVAPRSPQTKTIVFATAPAATG